MKVYLASISGGKDSTAMALHLREQGIPFRAVHFYTGWDHIDTVRYIQNVLPEHIGPIEILATEPELTKEENALAEEVEHMLEMRSPFVRWCIQKATFPNRLTRFCTEKLKIETAKQVFAREHKRGNTPISVVGIRAAESKARAQMPEKELAPTLDCMIWRPLINWSEQDVIALHKRHAVPPNPLYLRGALRVGCWPCVMARKNDIRMIDEKRIQVIERLEAIVGKLRLERRATSKRKSSEFMPHLFQTRQKIDGRYPPIPIRDAVAWANTRRGKKDEEALLLEEQGINEGCMRWGMCETPRN